MECPICGKNVKKLVKAEIEGSVIEVCENCARIYGKGISFVQESYSPKKKDKIRKENEIEEIFLVEGYGSKIKKRREELGLTRDKLAELLHEKESVIKRIENEEMIPNESLLKRIEKVLGISLAYESNEYKQERKTVPKLTLGDIAELK